MEYPKIELPRNGQYIHLNEPKIFHDEITQTYECVNKISVQINQMAETHIVQAIIDYAKEQGITDLFLIDEEFVKTALMREAERRRKPKTNFDRITESVESLAENLVECVDMELVGLRHKAGDGKLCATWEEAMQRTMEWLNKECEEL